MIAILGVIKRVPAATPARYVFDTPMMAPHLKINFMVHRLTVEKFML